MEEPTYNEFKDKAWIAFFDQNFPIKPIENPEMRGLILKALQGAYRLGFEHGLVVSSKKN